MFASRPPPKAPAQAGPARVARPLPLTTWAMIINFAARVLGQMAKGDELTYSQVFVPGGFPKYTYNPREGQKLESQLSEITDNLCKLAIVTGHTKSGKTVLVRRLLPRADTIWIDGGSIGSSDDFWSAIIDQLELFQTTSSVEGSETSTSVGASASGGANFIVAKGEAAVEGNVGKSRSKESTFARSVSSRTIALKGLSECMVPLVIDDFHYLPKEMQADVVRALKQPVFDGLPVVIIAIPHRRYDAVKVEKEMTGRILPIEVPLWGENELAFIPLTGFPLLDGSCSEDFAERLAKEAIGSPHLMQEFCRGICRTLNGEKGFAGRSVHLDESQLAAVFEDTAETIGRPIFEKLAKGPQQRSERIGRKLSTGETVDIYGLVLHALAHLRPGLVTVEYEDLRAAIRDVSAGDVPQLHEVTRVLRHMATIAATDQSSTPVIDFEGDEKKLHVTDPFFAFYLRWGKLVS